MVSTRKAKYFAWSNDGNSGHQFEALDRVPSSSFCRKPTWEKQRRESVTGKDFFWHSETPFLCIIYWKRPFFCQQFVTDGEKPGGPPKNVRITGLTSTSLEVTWDDPEVRLRHGIITRYNLGYREYKWVNIGCIFKYGDSIQFRVAHFLAGKQETGNFLQENDIFPGNFLVLSKLARSVRSMRPHIGIRLHLDVH